MKVEGGSHYLRSVNDGTCTVWELAKKYWILAQNENLDLEKVYIIFTSHILENAATPILLAFNKLCAS